MKHTVIAEYDALLIHKMDAKGVAFCTAYFCSQTNFKESKR